jgi:hypothetical protein
MQNNRTRRPARRCKTCQTQTPPGALVGGECPACAGLLALPLRDGRGRFLTLTLPVPQPARQAVSLIDPDPDLCCGVPAQVSLDDYGRSTGTCSECGGLLWRELDNQTNDTSNGNGGGER